MTIQLILCQQVFKDATYEDKVWVFGCIIEIRRLYQNSNKWETVFWNILTGIAQHYNGDWFEDIPVGVPKGEWHQSKIRAEVSSWFSENKYFVLLC